MAEPFIFADIATDLLVTAAQCLEDHTEAGAPAEVFLSHDGTPRFCCDYLSVHASLIYGTERFPAPQTTATRRCAELGQAMQLTLRLRRCDYPRLRPQREAPFPPADEITAASRDLLVDARVLWCCVVGAYDQGELFQNPNLDYLPAHERENTLLPTIFGQMTPVREASCAGWDWGITVEMAPCCGLPSIASGS